MGPLQCALLLLFHITRPPGGCTQQGLEGKEEKKAEEEDEEDKEEKKKSLPEMIAGHI